MKSHASILRSIALGAFTLAAGCATTSAPSARSEETAGSIRAAEEVGAPKLPQAAFYLQLAREQSDHAKALLANGQKDEAESLLTRANADAELAVALVRENDDKAAAQQAVDNVKALRTSSK
jgi:regulator of protease activity HflC (stomatin/prohibitin superfamily)